MDETKRQAMMSLAETVNQHIRSHEISDFRILTLEGDTLRLAGSFDLSYYHDVELTITGVSWLDLPTCFWLDLSLSEPFALTCPFNLPTVGPGGRGLSVLKGTSPSTPATYHTHPNREHWRTRHESDTSQGKHLGD